jgi:hypothetical protein
MTAQAPSDLNIVAIQEFKKLVDADSSLSEVWKKAVLALVQGGDVPPSLAELDAMLKRGNDDSSKGNKG